MLAVLGYEVIEGGYTLQLTGNYNNCVAILERMRTQGWLDDRTVAVALEFVTYNAQVRLTSLVRALWEFPVSGGSEARVEVQSAQLFVATNSFLNLSILFFLLLYVVYTAYLLSVEIGELRRLKWDYFKRLTNYIDMMSCSHLVATIILIFIFKHSTANLLNLFRVGEEFMGEMQKTFYVDTYIAVTFGVLLMLGMFKFLHLLRFNPLIFKFLKVLEYAAPSLSAMIFLLSYNFFFFGWFMLVFVGYIVGPFSSLSTSLTVTFEGFLGLELYLEELVLVHAFTGPAVYISFLMLTSVIGLNLMITVLVEALGFIKKHPLPNEESELLWLLFHKIVNYLGLRIRTVQ